jgi:adenosylcobinamide-phosphate synthase
MRFEYQILAAFALDLLAGDPRWFPHPVRLIGAFAQFSEKPLRRLIEIQRLAGILAFSIVVVVAGLSAFMLM